MNVELFELGVSFVDSNFQTFELKISPHELTEEKDGFINVSSNEDWATQNINSVACLDFSPTTNSFTNNFVFIFQLVGIVKIENGNFPNLQAGINYLGISDERNSLFFAFASGDGLIETVDKTIDFFKKEINFINTFFFPAKAIVTSSWSFPSTNNYIGSGDDQLFMLKYFNSFCLMNRGEGFFSDTKSVKMDRRFIPNKPLAIGLLAFPPVGGFYRVQGFVELSS